MFDLLTNLCTNTFFEPEMGRIAYSYQLNLKNFIFQYYYKGVFVQFEFAFEVAFEFNHHFSLVQKVTI